MPRRTAALAILLTCVVGTARGHDFWIEPSQFVVKPRESVSLYLREGENLVGNSLPYVTDWFRDFSRSDAQGREPVIAELGDNPAAVIGIRAAGTTLLGYWSTPNFVSLAPAKFESYLRQEGLEYVLAQRAQLGESGKEARENFVRCAKTYLSTNREALRAALRAPLGFTLELMPPDNLHALVPGDRLALHLLYLGKPLAGALVTAFRKDKPDDKLQARTDTQGRAVLRLSAPGVWLVKAVHMVRLENHPKADWESYWASLLFELRAR
jgi:uncharacterized GH25 family protein